MPDSVRMRLEVRAVLEYDARTEDYETNDPDKIASMDLESAEDDIFMFLDAEDVQWEIKVVPAERANAR